MVVLSHIENRLCSANWDTIMATANGRVTESRYAKGNGNYVKIRHNNKYYPVPAHEKKRGEAGQYVKQGDVIGWVGMTGYTSGPHVCYRF